MTKISEFFIVIRLLFLSKACGGNCRGNILKAAERNAALRKMPILDG